LTNESINHSNNFSTQKNNNLTLGSQNNNILIL
jgi:hypothetical protein